MLPAETILAPLVVLELMPILETLPAQEIVAPE
jgi:hypothetical protein